MGVQKEQKTGIGPALIIGVLLLDVGLMIWGWHLYQRRQESLDDAGLNFSRAPDPTVAPAVPAAPQPREEPLSGIDRYVKAEVLGPAPKASTAAAPGATAPAAAKPALAAAPPPSSPEMKRKMEKAVDAFFDLKNQPRFKNSKVVKAWKSEFLSHPDLRALNDQWRKEHDPLKFMMGMVRSPNFQKMAATYLIKPDVRDFVSAMAGSKAVKESAGTFMTDESVKTAVTAFGLVGSAPKDSSQQMERLKANPALQGALSGEAPPPVR